MIIGRNAYGALLLMDDASDPKGMRRRVLDPWTVTLDRPEAGEIYDQL